MCTVTKPSFPFLFVVSTVDRGALHGSQTVNDAIFCQLKMRTTRTCQWSIARMQPVATAHFRSENASDVLLLPEHHRMAVAARTDSPFYPQHRNIYVGRGGCFFCYCVVALSRTRVRRYILTIPCKEAPAPYYPFIAYTHS